MFVRLACELTKDSIVDGEGLRTVIWAQGCSHNCRGCHNKSTHDFNKGILRNVDDIIDEIKALRLQKGITLSGGDPFFQPKPFIKIAKAAKSMNLDVWAYTGFKMEDFLYKNIDNKEDILNLLNYIDILVDGKYEDDKRSIELSFRGSYNQRIIDVKKTIKNNNIAIYDKYINEHIGFENKNNQFMNLAL
ncbi:MAG: anaerobic ribonucleoside-triphosphate reductase activating protein [Peptostreptococcaceae bacterium]|jgi:anaerobic ribonucleoside-triphosphate reductase activating protein|nr:anaerobic ribonucleoside-triphosphate reductase activating protein [Peptostreptococcaceae bacterium]